MKIEMNKLMVKRLQGKSIEEWIEKYPLARRLKTLLKSGLIEVDGKVFLSAFSKTRGHSAYEDQTGSEMFVNKFHIDNPGKKMSSGYYLQQGLLFAFSLKDLLIKQFPGTSFKIIVNTDEGEDSFPDVCNVGFHKVRPGEFWLKPDLEGYKINGLLVITT